MKLKKVALAGVISLAAILATVAVAGAATGTTGAITGKTHPSQTSFVKHQRNHDGANLSARGKGHKGFPVLGTVSQLLGLQPDELTAEFRTGKSLKDIAAAKGMDIAKLTQDLQTAYPLRSIKQYKAEN
ncbi:MAG: hypothetical protein ACYCVD_02525 [Desulfitobacteriaceae bacterium]